MTICIAGKNDIAVKAMQLLLSQSGNYQLVACTNKSDNTTNSWQPSFKKFCALKNIPTLTLEELYDIEHLIFFSLEFDRIITPEQFKTDKLYNIHFSKLPAYKGMYTSVMPLLNGEKVSGVTLHCIDKGIDTGAIIDQLTFPIELSTTARQLYDLYLENAYTLFQKNIGDLIAGKIAAVPQAAIGSSYYSKSSLDFKNLTVDLNKTAFEIHNQIRAYSFREYQLPKVENLPIYKSEILDTAAMGKAGAIVYRDDWHLIVDCIDYQIKLYIDKEADLKEAASRGDLAYFKLLQTNNYPITLHTKEGWNALIIAAYHNQHDLVCWLCNNGFDVNATNYKGTTVAMYAMTAASKTNNLATLRYLAAWADFTSKDEDGKDIFQYAAELGNTEVNAFLESTKKSVPGKA